MSLIIKSHDRLMSSLNQLIDQNNIRKNLVANQNQPSLASKTKFSVRITRGRPLPMLQHMQQPTLVKGFSNFVHTPISIVYNLAQLTKGSSQVCIKANYRLESHVPLDPNDRMVDVCTKLIYARTDLNQIQRSIF